MINKKGFTLVELLITVAVVLIVLMVVITNATGISGKNKKKSWEEVQKEAELAAKDYFNTNEYYLETLKKDEEGTEIKISIGELIEEDYINIITNPEDGKQLNKCDYVVVKYEDNKFKYDYVSSDDKECEIPNTIEYTQPKAPDLDIKITGTQGKNDWYISDVTVHSTIKTNDGSPISKVEYCTSNDVVCNLSSLPLNTFNMYEVLTTMEGKTISTKFVAQTTSGKKIEKIINYKIDKNKPVCKEAKDAKTNSLVTTWVKGDRTINQYCDDSMSGCFNHNTNEKTNVFAKTFKDNLNNLITISDEAGHTSDCYVNTMIDNIPPVCDGNNGSTVWTNQDRTINQKCLDNVNGSGCESETYSKLFNYTIQKDKIIIKDKVGNEAICDVDVYVDKDKPTVSVNMYKVAKADANNKDKEYTSNTWYNKYVYTEANITSTISGIKEINFETIGAEKSSGSANYKNITKEGTSKIKYAVCNNAGTCAESNLEDNIIKLDQTKPVCSIKVDGTKGNKVNNMQWYITKNVDLTLSCSDSLSGIAKKDGKELVGLNPKEEKYNYKTTGKQSNEVAKIDWKGIAKDNAGNKVVVTSTFGLEKIVQIEFNKELTNQSTSDSSRTSAYGNKVFNTKKSGICGYGNCSNIKCKTNSNKSKSCSKDYFARACWYVDQYPRFFNITAKSFNGGTKTTVYANDAYLDTATINKVTYNKNDSLVRNETVLRYEAQDEWANNYYYKEVGKTSGIKNDFSAHSYIYTSPAGLKSNIIRLYTEYSVDCEYRYY